MSQWTISQIGKRVGLKPSAIRYYEEIGVLEPAQRVGGQRRYDEAALHRLVVVQRARALGFSLAEVRALFRDFPETSTPAVRWKLLADRKLDQLALIAEQIRAREALLAQQGQCACRSLEECGRYLAEAEACPGD